MTPPLDGQYQTTPCVAAVTEPEYLPTGVLLFLLADTFPEAIFLLFVAELVVFEGLETEELYLPEPISSLINCEGLIR